MAPRRRTASLWLGVICSLFLAAARGESPLTVITWNVFEGFRGGRTANAAVAWLEDAAPDLLALQELNGQTEDSLATLAARWGHDHAALLKPNGYSVGLTSRFPIEVIARHRQGLHHGCLQARSAGFEIFVVHLHPGSHRYRVHEAEAITTLARPLLEAGKPVLVLGDFNAHSAQDREFLDRQQPLLARRQGPNLVDGVFDYGVLNLFLKAGLADPSTARPPDNRTFPTRLLPHANTPETQAGFLERIDFVLTDRATADRATVAYPNDPVLDTISDHYPVRVTIRPSEPAEGSDPP
jgi:exodeoxyribonuclease III